MNRQVFSMDLREEITRNTKFFRKVLATYRGKLQLVSYLLRAGEQIEKEMHDTQVQFLYVESGRGIVVIYKNKKDDGEVIELSTGVCVIIPPKTYHYVHNDGTKNLTMFSLYCPPHFAPDRYDLEPE